MYVLKRQTAPSFPFVRAFVPEWNKLWFPFGLVWIIDMGIDMGIHSSDTVYLAQCRHILKFSSLDGYKNNNPVSYIESLFIQVADGLSTFLNQCGWNSKLNQPLSHFARLIWHYSNTLCVSHAFSLFRHSLMYDDNRLAFALSLCFSVYSWRSLLLVSSSCCMLQVDSQPRLRCFGTTRNWDKFKIRIFNF